MEKTNIETKFYCLKDQVNKGNIVVEYRPDNDQTIDIVTKIVKRVQFIKLRRELGVVAFDSLN